MPEIIGAHVIVENLSTGEVQGPSVGKVKVDFVAPTAVVFRSPYEGRLLEITQTDLKLSKPSQKELKKASAKP